MKTSLSQTLPCTPSSEAATIGNGTLQYVLMEGGVGNGASGRAGRVREVIPRSEPNSSNHKASRNGYSEHTGTVGARETAERAKGRTEGESHE